MDRYHKNHFRSYRKRDAKLRRLGFESYREYLDSDLWKSIRLKVLQRDDFKCVVCGQPAQVVHHANYSMHNLANGGPTMRSMCHGCHHFIEFDQDGKKVRLSESRSRLKLLHRLKGTEYFRGGALE